MAINIKLGLQYNSSTVRIGATTSIQQAGQMGLPTSSELRISYFMLLVTCVLLHSVY